MPQSKWVREHQPCIRAITAGRAYYEPRLGKQLEVNCTDCGRPFRTPFRQLAAAAVGGQVRAPERCAGCRVKES